MEDLIRAEVHNAKVLRNDKFDYKYTVTKLSDGSAISLSGKTLRLMVKKKGVTDAVAAKSINSGTSEMSIGGASNNEVTFDFIFDIASDLYVWDLENVTDNRTIFIGDLLVVDDVSK